MQALTSGDSNLVHGAMRVLTGTFCVFTSLSVVFNLFYCVYCHPQEIYM